MTNELLSQQITKFRKAAHLTQEELGKAVGVSTQAVSRWERGGAPDVTLLPAIADALHVTVDALFGREESKLEEMPQQLIRWLESIPVKDRLNRLFELLAGAYPYLASLDSALVDAFQSMPGILSTCYAQNRTWLRSGLDFDEGLALGIFSYDFPLYLLLPEPPQGYASQFAPTEDYRALFSVLSREGALEILYYLYGRGRVCYTASALSGRTQLPIEQVEPLLEAMQECQLLGKTTMETRAGSEPVYVLNDNRGLVPFLYFARWFMEEDGGWYMQWCERKRPTLVPAGPAAPESK